MKTPALELESAWSPRAHAPPNLGRETGFHSPRSFLAASRSPLLLTPSKALGRGNTRHNSVNTAQGPGLQRVDFGSSVAELSLVASNQVLSP